MAVRSESQKPHFLSGYPGAPASLLCTFGTWPVYLRMIRHVHEENGASREEWVTKEGIWPGIVARTPEDLGWCGGRDRGGPKEG